jgi:hypothetical protein
MTIHDKEIAFPCVSLQEKRNLSLDRTQIRAP